MKQNLLASVKCILVITSVAIMTIGNCIYAQDKAAKIEKLMQAYNDLGKFNGAILVAESGKVIFKRGYGLANREWNIPNDPETKFRIASITKQFTSVLIMQLVEDGKVNLDGRINDYLPEYREDIGEQVTIHHLLTHTSGIPDYRYLPDFNPFEIQGPFAAAEFAQKYCNRDLIFEPGSEWRYTNSGYYLLGVIIEKITGKTYEECLKERIFDPLGMQNTGYAYNESVISNLANGYVKALEDYDKAMYVPTTLLYAAGALYSTVEDLYIWDQSLYTDKLLSKRNRDIMFTPFLSNYSYGWFISKIPITESNDSTTIIMHPGWMPGFIATITRLPENQHLIVLLDNSGGSNEMNEGIINEGIINILYGRPYEMPKKDITDIMF